MEDKDINLAALYDICNNLEFNYEFGRGTHWLGETGLDYKYTNKSHIAQGWHNKEIEKLTSIIRQFTEELDFCSDDNQLYNHLLINQYLPKQKLNMHKDNEPELIGPIASLTLGASSRKPFSPYGSTLIANMKKHSVSSDNIAIKYGLADDSTVTPPNCVLMCEGNLHSYKGIETNNESRTDSSVAKSTDWFNFKLDLNVSNCTASIDGSVAITKTTDIPTNILQPFLYIQSRGAGTNERQWNTNYLEVYNR